MAASLGLVGHEAAYYAAAYPPPAASPYFPAELVADSGGVMEFPPAAAAADYYFPEIMGARAPEYNCSPPAPAFANCGGAAAAESGMAMSNMSYVGDDGRWMMMMRGDPAGNGGGCRRAPPRIGFRTRSEVDVLDDGFKWRKYGKKAVKSSPNPRNYYRCSSEGCGVKKRVERDRDDPRYVLTTYDGVHNHAAPGSAAAQAQCVPRPACSAAAAPWSAPGGVGAPCDDAWGSTQQLHAVAMAAAAAHSSESSY